MRPFKRDAPARVHTGRAVKAQLAQARTRDQRRAAFMANLGDGFFLRGGRTLYSDGGPGATSKTRPSKSAKRRARRRDLERRRRTPGGAFLP